MAKTALKRSRRTKKAAAAGKRGNKQAVKRTRRATRARKTARRETRKLATRPKPPALKRERRTLTEEPAAATTVVPETKTSNHEPRAVGESGDSDVSTTSSVDEEQFD